MGSFDEYRPEKNHFFLTHMMEFQERSGWIGGETVSYKRGKNQSASDWKKEKKTHFLGHTHLRVH